MPGDSNSAYNFEDTAPFRKLSDHDCQLLYHAQEEAIRHVAEADDILTKHSKSIIKNNISFFNRLDKVNKVIVIGHSLYKVDWNYFAAIIDNIKDANNVTWYIGCYGENDIQRAKEFINFRAAAKLAYRRLIHFAAPSRAKGHFNIQLLSSNCT